MDVPVEELDPKPVVKALAVRALPWRIAFWTRRAVQFCAASAPKLRPVVAADELRRAPVREHRLAQDADHVLGFDRTPDLQRHQLVAELIAGRQHLNAAPPPAWSTVKS